MVIAEATCKKCEQIINSQIETPVAALTASFRHRDMPARSKNKKRRRLSYDLRIQHPEGPETQHSLPASQAPRVLCSIAFPPPYLLLPHQPRKSPEMWTWANRTDLNDLKTNFGGVSHTVGRYDVDRYARQIAKIAHSYAAAICPDLPTFEQLLPAFILGGSGDYRDLVGGSLKARAEQPFLYTIDWGQMTASDYHYLVITFRPFAFTNGPLYIVAVARKPVSETA